jgi:catalase
MLSGTFSPSAEGQKLTKAAHIQRRSTPVFARFSSSTGLPLIPDTDPNANPRGLAIRFQLAEHIHTDIVSHSTDGFPARTGAEFLEFLKALASSGNATSHPTPIEAFLGSHPKALAFVQTPKPNPSSFARQAYFGVTAMRFTNANGKSAYGRYRIVPEAGIDLLDEAASEAKSDSFLFDELTSRIGQGPIRFQVNVQVANAGDITDDATEHWPEDRRVVNLGTVELTSLVANNDREQQHMIFDPIPRIDGVEPSDDPLLEFRAAVYLISGRRRRAAPSTESRSQSAAH